VGRRGRRSVVRSGALTLVVVAATACSSSTSTSSSTSKPATPSSRPSPTTTVVAPGADPAFIASVRSQPRLVAVGSPDPEWLDLGHSVCDGIHRSDLARGHGLGIASENVRMAQRSIVRKWAPGTADSIMSTAIGVLCPQYQSRWTVYRAELR
jgi:hypothetical protein